MPWTWPGYFFVLHCDYCNQFGVEMKYPDYMTLEDIAEFELDMARFDLDPSMEFDEINRILREIYLDQLVEQSEMLQFYNI